MKLKTCLGGGKSLVKSKTYLCLSFLFIITFFVMFSENFVNAAPKKKATVKRAAVNKASTKRAAVTGKNNKRAAVTGRAASRKRVMSRAKVSAPVVNANEAKETETENKEVAVEETVYAACPVEKVIAGRPDDNGNLEYYNGKDRCSDPENSLAYKWNSDLKSKYPKGSVKDSEAYYFKCVENYVVKTVDKERVCVSVLTTCPLGVVLEKTDDGYLSPETMEVCSLAANSQARLVKEGENDRGDIDDSSAYIAECNENKYSAPLDGTGSDLHLQCLSCPAGWKSPVGAKSESECVDVEAEKAMAEAKQKAEEEKASLEAEVKRLASLRIKKVNNSSDDYICIDGWTNHWLISDEGILAVSRTMDKNGVIKNVIDREHYGKNKVGCPIRSTNILTLAGIETLGGTVGNSNPSLLESVRVLQRPFLFMIHTSKPTVGLLRYKMEASDLDNTGVNGWTDEEYQKWGNYKPVIGLYYPSLIDINKINMFIKWRGKEYNIDKVKSGGLNHESNLFKYFD